MFCEKKDIQKKLRAIAASTAGSRADAKDLYQELMIHMWRIERQHPGNTESWYLKNCSFFGRDLLRKGKSIDSKKRAGVTRCSFDQRNEDGQVMVEPVEPGDFRSELILKETLRQLGQKLTTVQNRILSHMLDGYTVSEIARMFGKSHQYIAKERKKLARTAQKELL